MLRNSGSVGKLVGLPAEHVRPTFALLLLAAENTTSCFQGHCIIHPTGSCLKISSCNYIPLQNETLAPLSLTLTACLHAYHILSSYYLQSSEKKPEIQAQLPALSINSNL